jgi:hypothetical protein
LQCEYPFLSTHLVIYTIIGRFFSVVCKSFKKYSKNPQVPTGYLKKSKYSEPKKDFTVYAIRSQIRKIMPNRLQRHLLLFDRVDCKRCGTHGCIKIPRSVLVGIKAGRIFYAPVQSSSHQ